MKSLVVVVISLVVATATARAEQVTALSIASDDVEEQFAALAERREEPVGLQALSKQPKLGLVKGDIVRTINGEPAMRTTLLGEDPAVIHLEVLRGKRTVAIKLTLKVPREQQALISRRFVAMVLEHEPSAGLVQITKNGEPSGVIVRGMLVSALEIRTGDIIRKVDGARIVATRDAIAALQRARTQPRFVLDIERSGQPIKATRVLHDGEWGEEDEEDEDEAEVGGVYGYAGDLGGIEAGDDGGNFGVLGSGIAGGISPPASLDGIKKINATTFEVPRSLVTTVTDNPAVHAKGARMVPLINGGKTKGLKVYAIQSDSIYEALGLSNGDVLLSVNGLSLSQADKALEIYKQLREAATVKLTLQRGGKSMTLEYRVK
ncbi:MAG: hypothetical protein AB7R00_01060 [Kofleriaceae bacterium]